jgi:hypothetical protein
MNDLSLVISDSTNPSQGIVNLVLWIPEMALQIIQSIFTLPGTLVKRVLRVVLRVNGKSDVGKQVKGKGTRSPIKKRNSNTRVE